MEFIGKDHSLFEKLNKIYIVSSSIRRFNIFTAEDDNLVVEVEFKLLYDLGAILKLRFLGIKEYSFYWSSIYHFYNVETYTLIKKDNLFYICFDPEDESSLDILEGDQNFILFTGFEGYIDRKSVV
ncbi:hypothetical protein [Mucilaginibacter sp. OK283]|uniref:hypothetical protein n=1 Tax=Mucilaginibacter sp. OK283 TaxID=1881049 RepID=UPI0008B52247|nr:hypothetical protein [Mucilaginibacter sp. OK283]SEP38561.1 hypothetical protein SAMN05428947_113136 [Mucilaginibacter sp. OK283]